MSLNSDDPAPSAARTENLSALDRLSYAADAGCDLRGSHGAMPRRLFVIGLVGVLALVACDPVNPPEVGPRTEGPVAT